MGSLPFLPSPLWSCTIENPSWSNLLQYQRPRGVGCCTERDPATFCRCMHCLTCQTFRFWFQLLCDCAITSSWSNRGWHRGLVHAFVPAVCCGTSKQDQNTSPPLLLSLVDLHTSVRMCSATLWVETWVDTESISSPSPPPPYRMTD